MLDTLLKELVDTGADTTEIAYKTGISHAQIANLIAGRSTNPTLKTLDALRAFIDQKNKEKQA